MTTPRDQDCEYLQDPISGVSVVIPCKNEERAITQTIEQVRSVLEPLELAYEIIVVDDGSSDASRDKALAAGARVVVHGANLGYGNAVMSGVNKARQPYVAILDADGTYPVDRLPDLIRAAPGHDMVVGQRTWTDRNSSRLKISLRWLLSLYIFLVTNIKVPDINSGFRLFRKADLLRYRSLLCPTFSFTTSLTLLFKLLHRPIIYVPIAYDTRIGKSKVSLLRDTLRTLSYVFLIANLFRPYRLAAVILGAGLLLNLAAWALSLACALSVASLLGLFIAVNLTVFTLLLAMIVMPLSRIAWRVFSQDQD